MPTRSRISRSAQFAAGTTLEMLSIFGSSGGQIDQHAAEQVVFVESEIVRNEKLPEKGRSSAPMLMTYRASRSRKKYWQTPLDVGRVDVDKQAIVCGQVGTLDGRSEFVS